MQDILEYREGRKYAYYKPHERTKDLLPSNYSRIVKFLKERDMVLTRTIKATTEKALSSTQDEVVMTAEETRAGTGETMAGTEEVAEADLLSLAALSVL